MAKASSTRRQIFKLVGGRVDILVGVILALLWQAKAAASEQGETGPGFDHLDLVLPGEAALIAAIDRAADPSISLDELRALLTPDELVRLGLDPDTFGDLLAADPKAAIHKLDAAFKAKLKLVAATAPAKAVITADNTSVESAKATGAIASDAGIDSGGGGGNGILYALGGLLGAGGAAGVAMGGGGGKAAAPIAPPPPTNAAPIAVADTVMATEDTAITFDVRTNDSDANGDALAVTAINGTAITTTSPVTTTGGSISLGSDGRLTFTQATNFNGPANFSYTVSDGKGGTASATTTLTVSAVNDAPVNTGPATAIAAAQSTTVAITGLAIADVDAGIASMTTTLAVGNGALFAAAIPGGASLSGSGSATLTLTGTVVEINASLSAITYRGIAAGTDRLTVTTNDGTSTDIDSFPITVAVVQTGVISDGYIAGGTVFIDANGSGVFDPGEPTAQTDGAGRFSIATDAVGTIIAFGGINADTGLANLITMRAPAGSMVVNPLTTIVQQLVAGGASLATANASVAAAFGLPAGTDFGSFDILAASDPALGLAAQKAASIVATLLIFAHEAAEAGASDAAEAAVLGRIVTLVGDGQVDFGDGTVLTALFTGVAGIDAGVVANIIAAGVAIVQTIATATSLDALTTVIINAPTPAPNLAPVATADTVTTRIGTPVTFDVTANDRDADGNPLAVTAIGGAPISLGSPVAVEGGSVALNADGSLTFTPVPAFVGSPQFDYTVSDRNGGVASGAVTISVAPAGANVAVDAADIGAFANNADILAAAGVTTLDVSGDVGLLGDTDAGALVAAGIDFAEADQITVEAQGTQLSTSLKGLQDLKVDTVAVGVGIGVLSVDAGAAGLGGLSAAGLPSFSTAQADGALDVTLNIAPGTLDPSLNLAALAPALAAVGIDHLGVVGGSVSLTTAQAAALGDAGLDFAPGADVTLAVLPDELSDVAASATDAAAAGIDHIDVVGDAITLADADAGALVGAGLDFADADQVTVAAEGTQLATTLKGLQDLRVDTVALGVGIGMLSVDAGAQGFGGIAATGLPDFIAAAGNADITLTQAGGTLDATVDLALLAPSLAVAGIDHLGTIGDAALAVNLEQANALTGSGVNFAAASDITVRVTDADASTAAAQASALAAINVDHLRVIDGAIAISDREAGQFVAAGLDFAESDDVSVAAEGTHLATTLKGLQDLNVDSVSVQPGVQTLFVAAGDLAAIAANGLPQFDIGAAATLDVTLAVAAADLAELPRLAEALRAAGVDHIAIDAPLDSLGSDIAGLLADITAATGIDFVEQPVAAPNDLYRTLMAELESGDAPSQTVELNDSVVASIVQAGMLGAYLAENLTIDATGAGDKPMTSLKSVADLSVDAVHLADQHDSPVYIDLGIDATALSELQSLFAALDPGTGYSRIFTGTDHVALVVDAQTADLLAGVDGALANLAQLGFTEIDVLAGSHASLLAGDGAIEVKLIGQDDDLYDYLSHGRA